ncbi:hypothetical protein E2562_020717 [Oryza meyeriana var. granulata]|uniref:Uncharacterized protein n=1 Tax=Oryza meyeriana var. granulata TaxID=110450 RepID=A0A6G1EN64_9ORYZ|nr:hypothetical protein E2562_020717 [Oryza meyeriana var. granulata]
MVTCGYTSLVLLCQRPWGMVDSKRQLVTAAQRGAQASIGGAASVPVDGDLPGEATPNSRCPIFSLHRHTGVAANAAISMYLCTGRTARAPQTAV